MHLPLSERRLIIFSKKNESSLLKMRSNIEYSCRTVTNIKHGRRLSLQLMTIRSLTCNYTTMLVYLYLITYLKEMKIVNHE